MPGEIEMQVPTRGEPDADPRPGRGVDHHRALLYLAEDDDDIRESLAALFEHDGFAVRAAPDGARLFEWLFEGRRPPSEALPDVIITDHRMPGYCALDILAGLAGTGWRIPVIVITAYGDEIRDLATLHGAYALFDKPFEPDDLCAAAMGCIGWGAREVRPNLLESDRNIVRRARLALRRSGKS
jgi:CheY-like chemotaxis protein